MVKFFEASMDLRAEVTRLLIDWRNGEKGALDSVVPFLYDELHRSARALLRLERPDHTLQPTALVNEAYLRLVDQAVVPACNGRAHFVAIAARVMRQILVEHARAHCAAKRGGGQPKLTLEGIAAVSGHGCAEFLDLDMALSQLAERDGRKAQVIEMRYFGGLGEEEIANLQGTSPATVRRDMRFAEAWLRSRMRRQ